MCLVVAFAYVDLVPRYAYDVYVHDNSCNDSIFMKEQTFCKINNDWGKFNSKHSRTTVGTSATVVWLGIYVNISLHSLRE